MKDIYSKHKEIVYNSVARRTGVTDKDILENALTDSFLAVSKRYDRPEIEMVKLWSRAAGNKVYDQLRIGRHIVMVAIDSLGDVLAQPEKEDLRLDERLRRMRADDRRLVLAVLENQIKAVDDTIRGIRGAMRRWFFSNISPKKHDYTKAMRRIADALNS